MKQKALFLTVLSLCVLSQFSFAANSGDDLERISMRRGLAWQLPGEDPRPAAAAGGGIRVLFEDIRPAQVRVSIKNIEKKCSKILEDQEKPIEERKRRIEEGVFSRFKDDGPPSHTLVLDPIPVIKVEEEGETPKYYLIDGHHELLAALRLREHGFTVTHAVVEVKGASKTRAELEELMASNQRQFSDPRFPLRFYLFDFHGMWQPPLGSLEALDDERRNDPNRWFLKKTKVKAEEEKADWPAFPLWVKVKEAEPDKPLTPPFAEFILGDLLKVHGFEAKENSHKNFNEVRHAWGILDVLQNSHPLPWLGVDLSWLVLIDPEDVDSD